MKKIVAIVLAMVMVLGLSTVAFADTTSTTLSGKDYSIYAVAGTTPEVEKTDITKTVKDKLVETSGTETVTTYYATEYAVEGGETYVEVDVTCATHKLMKGNTIVAYIVAGSDVSTQDVVAKSVKAVKEAKATCGDYVDNDETTVYVVGENVYFADPTSTTYALLNGKFVGLGADASAALVKHVLEANSFNAADATIATVKCATCKKVFNVLSAKDVVGMAPAAYAYDADLDLFYATGAVAADAAGDKVESAQTFDAGIAMYVGMSVMAAAGSAVVLKKKD